MNRLILSTKFSARLLRHAIFWLLVITFYTAQFSFEHYQFDHSILHNISTAARFIPAKILLTDILFCYPAIYLLIPGFFQKKKYVMFSLLLLTLFITVFAISSFYKYRYFHVPPEVLFRFLWGTLIDFIVVGPIALCTILISIKMLKTWYIKEAEKRLLVAANADAEMQLLKAQLHPHFLFNTLNNIYSFALDRSPKAGEMVLHLSDIMKYMITDCHTRLVSLDKELKIMDDYLALEQVRYGNQLDLQQSTTGEAANKLITPLLMIPFVENTFKHGAGRMLKDPWIKLFIQVDDNVLHFSLTNNKPAETSTNGKSGIGLNNVKQRLELLYPQNHLLTIESTINTFTVNMQVPVYTIEKEVVA